VLFRRYETKNQEAGWKVVPVAESTASAFREFGGSDIYLSDGPVPGHEQDFDFTKAAAEHLMHITGGRKNKKELEMTNIRLFHKQSAITKVFTYFKKITGQALQLREIYLNGEPYSDIYTEDAIWQYKLYQDLDNKMVVITKKPSGN
jgi:hypothetical protein